MKLTRSPGLSYLWMGVAIAVVAVLFTRWQWFISYGRQRLWWELLIAFLVADYLFLIIPIQDHKSIRRLSAAGKMWAAAAWMCCVGYLAVIARGVKPVMANSAAIIRLGLLGLLVLVLLVFSVYRLSHEWIRESLRSVAARTGGGFLVRFVKSTAHDAEMMAGLQAIPGAQPLEVANEWSVPADAAAAAALLQFAKKYDFDFVPSKTNFKEALLSGR
jgi:hypothetical protein